MITLDSI
jgi:hypothetical protein